MWTRAAALVSVLGVKYAAGINSCAEVSVEEDYVKFVDLDTQCADLDQLGATRVLEEPVVLAAAARSNEERPMLIQGSGFTGDTLFKVVGRNSDCEATAIESVRPETIHFLDGNLQLVETEPVEFNPGNYKICVDIDILDDESEGFELEFTDFTVKENEFTKVSATTVAGELSQLKITGFGLTEDAEFQLVPENSDCDTDAPSSGVLAVINSVQNMEVLADAEVELITSEFEAREGVYKLCGSFVAPGNSDLQDTGLTLDFGSAGVSNVLERQLSLNFGVRLTLIGLGMDKNNTKVRLVEPSQACSSNDQDGIMAEVGLVETCASHGDDDSALPFQLGWTSYFQTTKEGEFKVCVATNISESETFQDTDLRVLVNEAAITFAAFRRQDANKVLLVGSGIDLMDTKIKVVENTESCDIDIVETDVDTITGIFSRGPAEGQSEDVFYQLALSREIEFNEDADEYTLYKICVQLNNTLPFEEVATHLSRFKLVGVEPAPFAPLVSGGLGTVRVHGVGISEEDTQLKLVEEDEDCDDDGFATVPLNRVAYQSESSRVATIEDRYAFTTKLGAAFDVPVPEGVTGDVKICAKFSRNGDFKETDLTVNVIRYQLKSAVATGFLGSESRIELEETYGLVPEKSAVKLVRDNETCSSTGVVTTSVEFYEDPKFFVHTEVTTEASLGDAAVNVKVTTSSRKAVRTTTENTGSSGFTEKFTPTEAGTFKVCVSLSGDDDDFEDSGATVLYENTHVFSYLYQFWKSKLFLFDVIGANLEEGGKLSLISENETCSETAPSAYEFTIDNVNEEDHVVFWEGRLREMTVQVAETASAELNAIGLFYMCAEPYSTSNYILAPVTSGVVQADLPDEELRVCSTDGFELGFYTPNGDADDCEGIISKQETPTSAPTVGPISPTAPTISSAPGAAPTPFPTFATVAPFGTPTVQGPTNSPTVQGPTRAPTAQGPTNAPTSSPTSAPTIQGPTASPTIQGPTASPTIQGPTTSPTIKGPTASPTIKGPTVSPTVQGPTTSPTVQGPTTSPTVQGPTIAPTAGPSVRPVTSQAPTRTPTISRGGENPDDTDRDLEDTNWVPIGLGIGAGVLVLGAAALYRSRSAAGAADGPQPDSMASAEK
eukprot:CAMPEP_0184538010 /NCGR_PEP_ID=MMETSP0198_2-20121128/17369_1 /TAXON_ID=1112570 /ORGANISM="Thraustochytrium sp., Strain LLF1b" /LENGTH=1120 /DNA_ID=CAMNT_0026931439 /DNA_START=83 /DNA_END=3445 /DNA_ORIENTATION=-